MSRKRRQALRPADLFVVLDKAYRRRARRCGKCGFSLPYPVFRGDDAEAGDWAVLPSDACTHDCVELLEELVGRFQKDYRLSPSGGPGQGS